MKERDYQIEVRTLLARIYTEVETQWYPFRGRGREIYSPAIDIAVGPFAISERHEERYTNLLEHTRVFINNLIDIHNKNVEIEEEQTSFEKILLFNENARCLIGIEVEKTGSRKHCIGDLVNASALGRIGLLIAWNPDMLRVFLRQRMYLSYLKSVGKNTFRTDNALVLTKDQFDDCLHGIA